MTLFGTRRGPRQWLTAFVIAALAMTTTPMPGFCDSISAYELLMKYIMPVKKPIKQTESCPNAACCVSGQCNANGVCCPAGGCCTLPLPSIFPQPTTCPLGVCTGAALLPYCPGQCPGHVGLAKMIGPDGKIEFSSAPTQCCPVNGCTTPCCQEICRVGNVCIIIVSNGDGRATTWQGTEARPAIKAGAVKINFDAKIDPSTKQVLDKARQAFVSALQPSLFWHGVAPAGSFTPDLGVPICATCVQPPKPQGSQIAEVRVVIKKQVGDLRKTAVYPVADLIQLSQGVRSPKPYIQPVNAFHDFAGSPTVCPVSPCDHVVAVLSENKLIELITRTVAPRTWSNVGGKGTIQYFPLGNVLVVGQQTEEVHQQIQCVLSVIRQMQAYGLISKLTACATCDSCNKAPSADQFGCLVIKPEQSCSPLSQPVRVSKPDQCGMCCPCVPAREAKPDDMVRHVSFVDSVNCAEVKKCADELQRLCVEHERTIHELQEITNDLRQQVFHLRHEIHMGRHVQPTFAPPYNMQPVSFPQHQMPETYFFVPSVPPGHPMSLTGVTIDPRIPR